MRSSNIFAYILVIFVLVFSVKIYFESDAFNLKCIISNEDGNTYCVRETPKLQLVADLLARTTVKRSMLSLRTTSSSRKIANALKHSHLQLE